VTFGAINNNSGQDPNGYGDYTSVSTNIFAGDAYNISINGNYYDEYFSVWIDYDKDGVFASSEQVVASAYGYGSYSTSIIIPSTVSPGITRMRVLVSYLYSQSNSACGGGITYGEVEDYSVNIIPAIPSYCAITNNNNSTLWIDNVSISTLNNSSVTDPNGYGDYTSLIVPLNRGNSYNLDIEVGPYPSSTYQNIYLVSWIDFNGDGTFSNTDERFSSILTSGNRNASMNIIVPASVTTSYTGMRILTTTNLSNSMNACSSNMYYGEMEDYTIHLTTITGLKNTAVSENSLVISPNPNEGIFDVNINVPGAPDLSLQILNTLGEIVKEDIYPAGNSFTKSYDLSGLASGMYYVKLIIGQGTVIIKKVITE
jgi:hypothetical protein